MVEWTTLVGMVASAWVIWNAVGSSYHNYKVRQYERRQAEALERVAGIKPVSKKLLGQLWKRGG